MGRRLYCNLLTIFIEFTNLKLFDISISSVLFVRPNNIILSHGGKLELLSSPLGGLRVKLSLPQ